MLNVFDQAKSLPSRQFPSDAQIVTPIIHRQILGSYYMTRELVSGGTQPDSMIVLSKIYPS